MAYSRHMCDVAQSCPSHPGDYCSKLPLHNFETAFFISSSRIRARTFIINALAYLLLLLCALDGTISGIVNRQPFSLLDMGQIFSQQAAPTRSPLNRNRHVAKGQHSRREGWPLHARVGNMQAIPKANGREELNSSQPRTSDRAQDNSAYSCLLAGIDKNLGASQRQSKYPRSQTFEDPPETKHHGHKSTREVDDRQPASQRAVGNDKSARSRFSRSGSYHANVHLTKDCMVCADTRSLHRFPDRTPTDHCAHDVNVCRRCLRAWIQSEFSIKIWNEINCPTCATRMQYEDIHKFASSDVFRRSVSDC
jgi:hypothetical protein